MGRGHLFPGENWGVCVPGPRREQIIRLQGQVDKHYAGLKEAAEERRRRLENMSHLFQLKREVEDLEQWIAERDVVASSQEMGQDLDHVTVRMLGRGGHSGAGVWFLGGRGANRILLSPPPLCSSCGRSFGSSHGRRAAWGRNAWTG